MENFGIIVICILVGFWLRRTARVAASGAHALNVVIIHISLPAVVLIQIPSLLAETPIDSQLLIPISMPWLHFLMTGFLVAIIGRSRGWSRAKTGALVMTAGLGNTSFVGFPLLEALRGPSAIPVAALIDQAGSFLTLSTLGITTAAYYGGSRVSLSTILKKILFFPPFIALSAAVLWHLSGVGTRPWIAELLARLASTLVPLALLSVGMQLEFSRAVFHRRWSALAFGLGYKLALAPLIFLLLYRGMFEARGSIVEVTILQSAMAPMITAAIVAQEFRLDSDLANLMVGVGIPLSLVTVSIWNLLL